MTPFRDAVSLINGNASQFFLLMHNLDMLSKVVCGALLWCNIKKSGKGMAGCQVFEKSLLFGIRCTAADAPGFNISNSQCIYLIGLEYVSSNLPDLTGLYHQ
jgi:hypothetical protein